MHDARHVALTTAAMYTEKYTDKARFTEISDFGISAKISRFQVRFQRTCTIFQGSGGPLVLERDEFTAGAKYGLRRIGNGKTHN